MSLNPLRRRSPAATDVRDDRRDDLRDDVRDDVKDVQHDVDRPRAGRHADETVVDAPRSAESRIDPVDRDRVDPDRVDRDRVDRDRVNRDPVDRDRVNRDPVDRDPVNRDPVDGALVNRDPVDRDPVNRDAPTVVERDTPTVVDRDAPRPIDRADAVDLPLDRSAVVARERAAFGGLKIGSAFFGWLAAMGTAVLLSAIVAAAITAVRVASGEGASTDPATIAAGAGVGTDVAIVVILFVAYYCGGYVAGRMARFDGAQQGLAVWVLALVAALLITALGTLAGANWDLLGTLNGFPRLQDAATNVTTAGVVTTLIALAAALAGAVLGGLAGMRFHRRVDRVGLGA
jgi:hypothetical protein